MVANATVPTPYRWTVEEYHRLGELGFFADQRTELLDGEIIVMPPRLEGHSFVVMRVRRALERSLPPTGYLMREEKLIRLGGGSEPEPDVAVVEGTLESFRGSQPPVGPVLVVEVSVTTLASDEERMGLYAREGVPETWLVDVRGRCLRAHRRPVAAAGTAYGHRYAEVTEYRLLEATVVPLVAGAKAVVVGDLLLPPDR